MGCANAYDWVMQSSQHKAYARSRLPFIARLVATSNGYKSFVANVQRLDALGRTRYNNEYRRWWESYGHVWDRIGCVGEVSVGEHTDKYAFKKDQPNRRAHMGAPFAGTFGAETVERPELEPGYVWCGGIPGGGMAISETRNVDNRFGWTYVIYASADGEKLYYLYHDTMTNTDYWACPKVASKTTPYVRSEVMEIQRRLKKFGFDPGTIDGIPGPKTCQAAYSYKKQVLQENNSTLGKRFWYTLGLPDSYINKYGRMCDKWFTADLGPGPDAVKPDPKDPVILPKPKPDTPEVKPDPDEPIEVAKAGFPTWLGVLLGGGLLFAAFKIPKKGKRKKKR